MAAEILYHDAPGLTLKFISYTADMTQVWNPGTSADVAYVHANRLNYLVAMSEAGAPGNYIGNHPLTPAGKRVIEVVDAAGTHKGISTLAWDGASAADDLTANQIQTECEQALATYNLHRIFGTDWDPAVHVVNNSWAARMMAKGTPANATTYNNATDSLEAIRDNDVYHARPHFTRDQTNAKDEYTLAWFKNGVPVTSGITSPTIQVVQRADGTDLVAQTAMTEIGTTRVYKYDASGAQRLTLGEAALAIYQATIDGAVRTWREPVGRDG